MSKLIEKINNNPFLIFILSVNGIVDLIIRIRDNFLNSINEMKTFDWHILNDIVQIITVFILYRLLKLYSDLKKERQSIKDLEYERVIYKYRCDKFYKYPAALVSLTNKKTDIASYTGLMYYDTFKKSPLEVSKQLHAEGFNICKEYREEKEYFLDYLNSQNIPRTEAEKEALIKKYTMTL